MPTAFDVARYIGTKHPELVCPDASTAERAKLQKLLYYTQAWNLAWHDEPMFCEEIQAWHRGPVCAEVYRAERAGTADLHAAHGLSDQARTVVDMVLAHYGDRTGGELSELTHREDPWRTARQGLAHDAPSDAVISIEAMKSYFKSLALSAEERAADLSTEDVERWIDSNYANLMRRLAQ